MFGVRLSSLFTSRWMALLWAVLVLLTAIQFVGTDDGKGQGANASASNSEAQETLTPEQKAAIDKAF